VVSKASPTIITTASSAVTLGTGGAPTLSDSAVVSGGYHETGTLHFVLEQGTVSVYTHDVGVSGNGTYNSGGYPLPTSGAVTGTYPWTVTYGGDANDNTASDQGGTAEQTVVSPASPTLYTTASANVDLDGLTTAPMLTDTAVLSGGY